MHIILDAEEPATYGYGVRHVQAGLIFICLTLGYATRGHLGVTIVAMTMLSKNVSPDNATELSTILNENITTVIDGNDNLTLPNITSMIKYEDSSGIYKVSELLLSKR